MNTFTVPYRNNLKFLARKLRQDMTLGEILLWQELRNKKLGHKFARQRPIGNYIIDFFCKEKNLAIEIDGCTHDFEDAYQHDMKRQLFIEACGIKVLRYTDHEVKTNLCGVITHIQLQLREIQNR